MYVPILPFGYGVPTCVGEHIVEAICYTINFLCIGVPAGPPWCSPGETGSSFKN